VSKWASMTALVGAAAIVLAACGDAPQEDAESSAPVSATAGESAAPQSSAETAVEADFQGCMVTDSGGVDDRSFNASAAAGLARAETELGITTSILESTAETDYGPNIDQLLADDCGLIVTVGFLLAGGTGEAAVANPDQNFALIDSTPTDAAGEPVDAPNVKPLLFNTAEAAFLAGYVAAGTTTSGMVATFGGIPIPPVTIFMDGFVDGVAYYNTEKGASVTVLGWDKAAQDGTFVGNFDDQTAGRTTAENFISQGADIIFPVAGPVGLGAAAAAQDSGTTNIIWVDTDGFISAPDFGSIIITSVLKNIDAAVYDTIESAVNGEFDGTPYVGTLDNGGVGIAPYHDFEETVPAELKTEVEALQEAIIAGEVVVESASSPSVG